MIDQAEAILRTGGLVAFPTETVYGLGADATNAAAVRRIFAAKGRPGTNPLICHVADAEVARRYAAAWPDVARRLAERFWPGPLTLVLAKSDAIVPEVTAGLGSVGLRVPDHPLALELLRAFDGPLAGPSANRSNRVSPTTADHVRDELGDAVDLILDGGPCAVGIESTVLDLTDPARPTILRHGGASRARIEAAIGPVLLREGFVAAAGPASSPGQQPVHYSPKTRAVRFETSQRGLIHPDAGGRPNGIVAMCTSTEFHERSPIIEMPRDPAAYARLLYAVLRELDAQRLHTIYIEMPPDAPEWAAVRDRVTRATRAM